MRPGDFEPRIVGNLDGHNCIITCKYNGPFKISMRYQTNHINGVKPLESNNLTNAYRIAETILALALNNNINYQGITND